VITIRVRSLGLTVGGVKQRSPCRIYAVGSGLALTLALSPRRGEAHWPRWDESLIGEDPEVLESVSLSLGERVGVRASVLRN